MKQVYCVCVQRVSIFKNKQKKSIIELKEFFTRYRTRLLHKFSSDNKWLIWAWSLEMFNIQAEINFKLEKKLIVKNLIKNILQSH